MSIDVHSSIFEFEINFLSAMASQTGSIGNPFGIGIHMRGSANYVASGVINVPTPTVPRVSQTLLQILLANRAHSRRRTGAPIDESGRYVWRFIVVAGGIGSELLHSDISG